MLKGAIHTHSTYSDGEFTLRQLCEVFRAAGCSFVCVTDHAEYFSSASLESYIQECKKLSDGQFILIPGLEFNCDDRMHILSYGAPALAGSTDPQEVIRHIQRFGGLAVIAHPRDSAFPRIESFETLPDGIEAWNSKYDGRYAPRPAVFDLLLRLQKRKPEMRAYYGQDLHWKKQFRGLLNVLPLAAPDRARILQAFARGDFRGQKSRLELPSDGQLPEGLAMKFERSHARSDRMRWLMRSAKKMADRVGVALPRPLKSHLRRIF